MNKKQILAVIALLTAFSAWARSPTAMLANYIENKVEHEVGERIKDSAKQSAPEHAFAKGTTYRQCFVPDGASCEKLIVEEIDKLNAGEQLLIQAYSFTNSKIAEAVRSAHRKGVVVKVIVDKSQQTEKYTSATFLKNAGIEVVVDTNPAIAHNKVMVFGNRGVFTGSFNFTSSAENRNAENGIVILGDRALVASFYENWAKRYRVSSRY